MKKTVILFLALTLALGCVGAAAFADDAAPSPTPVPSVLVSPPPSADLPADTAAQIQLIFTQFDSLKQNDSPNPWSYAVTDLDHNGRVELLAGTIEGSGRYTTVKAWEVSADKTALSELRVPLADGDSFPDIVTDAADTFHDKTTDYWYYMFNDHITVSTQEVYANKSAIALVQGELQFATYAFQHNEWTDGRMVTTFTNNKGDVITPEDYNAVGSNVFSKMDRSATYFDWFPAADAASADRFTDSCSVFLGLKQPPKTAAHAPVLTPRPDTDSVFLTVTKNPTNEYHNAGETAWFIANADNWSTATWTFVDPYGNACSWQSFQSRFPYSTVNGGDSTSISIINTDPAMTGWSAYCTFYGNNQTARTTAAYLTVQSNPQPTYGQMDGSVTNIQGNYVTIALNNGASVTISLDICNVDGNLDVGNSATVYYSNYPSSDNIYSCYIQGDVGPVTGQMDGYVTDAMMSTVTIALNNGDSVQILRDICQVDGTLGVGDSATVYYYNYPSSDNIYYCYIQGGYDPGGGQMGATFVGATMSGSGFILDNGANVTVPFSICTNYGNVTYGDSATVYYNGSYPSSDSIYYVEVYGSGDDDPDPDPDPEPWIDPVLPPDPDDPDDPGPWVGPVFDGGYAGMNYYNSMPYDSDEILVD